MSSSALVVSIHDVSPLTRELTDNILSALRSWGVGHCSLLVVPDHHHRADLRKDPGFQNWLSTQVNHGHEAVLHGFFHQRERAQKENLRTSWITRVYTADEGEFYDIDLPTAKSRLIEGLEVLRFLPQRPSGFIAPAWLLSKDAELAAKECGFTYTTRLREVLNLQTDTRWTSQSLVWSTRSAWRRASSLLWNRALFDVLSRQKNLPLLRIGIHPPDWNFPAIRAQLQKLCNAALASRPALTYETWVSSQDEVGLTVASTRSHA